MYIQELIVTTFLFALAQSGAAYPYYAANRGWPRGELSGGSWWNIYHGIAMLVSASIGWKYEGIVGVIFVVFFGFITAFFITNIFKSIMQILSILSIPLVCIWFYFTPY